MDGSWTELLEAAAEVEQHTKEPVATVPGLTLHIDGDYAAYYCAGNDECEEWQARENVLSRIKAAKNVSGAEKVIMHNTHSASNKGERYVVATVKPYQAQRVSDRKPKNYRFMRDFLIGYDGDAFVSKTWANREADDGMAACMVYDLTKPQGHGVILTRDKDLQMVPGLHIDWMTMQTIMVPAGAYAVEQRVGLKDRVYGLKWFWLQMLMGDTADHIPGLEGYAVPKKDITIFKPIGEKTAYNFLEGCTSSEEAFEVVRALYQGFYDPKGVNWADRFVEQAALLWMRTDPQALVGDFARHEGVSRINQRFCDETWAAVQRLEDRVKETRAAANALTNS